MHKPEGESGSLRSSVGVGSSRSYGDLRGAGARNGGSSIRGAGRGSRGAVSRGAVGDARSGVVGRRCDLVLREGDGGSGQGSVHERLHPDCWLVGIITRRY